MEYPIVAPGIVVVDVSISSEKTDGIKNAIIKNEIKLLNLI